MMWRSFPAYVALIALGIAGAGCQGSGAAAGGDPAGDALPDVSVTVAPIVRTTLHGYVTGWGTVDPESAVAGRPPARAAVAAPVSGLITAIQCAEGERVNAGATLFRLDSRLADVAVERAQQAVQYAQMLVRRQEELGPGEATSQKAYQDAKQQLMTVEADLDAADVQRRLLDVKAPIDGTITRINAKLGDAIDPTTVLAEMIDLTRLVANAAVRSVDARLVKRGQIVELVPGAAPGATPAESVPAIATTVEYVGPQVNSASDTVLVRARVPATSGLRPGQFVNARISTDERRGQLAVPVESLLQGPAGAEIAVVEGDTAIRTPVTAGLRDRGLVQVDGKALREGASVVVQGAYGLPPKARIKVIGK